MKPTVAIVTGLPGVGKSTLSALLAAALGEQPVNSGDLLRVFLREQGVALGDELQTGDAFISRFGELRAGEVIADAAIARRVRVIDGVRLYSTLEALKARGECPAVLYLTVLPEVRRSRFLARALAEGVADVASAERLMAAKDSWAGDLEQFGRASRWSFDNVGSIYQLQRFAASVALEFGELNTKFRAEDSRLRN